MAALPYMQFYVADYLADTMHLSLEKHGAYMLLMMNYWQTGKPLPDDDVRLQCICKATAEQWEMLRPSLQEFFHVRDGFWYHNRIERDLEKVHSKSEQARKAAQKRHNRPDAQPEECGRTANAERAEVPEACHTDTDTDTEADTDTHSATSPNGGSSGAPDYQCVVDAFNEILGGTHLPKVKTISKSRKRLIKARWKETWPDYPPADTADFWRQYFTHVSHSQFLTGTKPGTDWKPTFDWLLNEANMTKVIEGNYHQEGGSYHSVEDHNKQVGLSWAARRSRELREIHESRSRHSGFSEIDYSKGLILDAPEGQSNF